MGKGTQTIKAEPTTPKRRMHFRLLLVYLLSLVSKRTRYNEEYTKHLLDLWAGAYIPAPTVCVPKVHA